MQHNLFVTGTNWTLSKSRINSVVFILIILSADIILRVWVTVVSMKWFTEVMVLDKSITFLMSWLCLCTQYIFYLSSIFWIHLYCKKTICLILAEDRCWGLTFCHCCTALQLEGSCCHAKAQAGLCSKIWGVVSDCIWTLCEPKSTPGCFSWFDCPPCSGPHNLPFCPMETPGRCQTTCWVQKKCTVRQKDGGLLYFFVF